MVHRRSTGFLFACLVGLVASSAIACSAPSPRDAGGGDGTTGSSRIIGGVDATSASLDAVGSLMYRDPKSGNYAELCTATLISPTAILTAKHCAIQAAPAPNASGKPAFSACTAATDCQSSSCTNGVCDALHDDYYIDLVPMQFAIGANASAPKRVVPLASVSVCGLSGGGFASEGCDLAVYWLAQPITDVAPLTVADAGPPGADLVGKKVTAVGYGDQDQKGLVFGTRRLGTLTVGAVTGQPLHALFPTQQAFLDAYRAQEGDTLTTQYQSALDAWYDESLLETYELWAGGADGDAQVCHGDSGGPLLAAENGKLVVHGVASTVIPGARNLCETMGGAYAAFGDAARQLIDSAVNDPCAALPPAGACDGDVAVRCTTASEGPRRVTRTDCGAALQHCVAPSAPADNADGGAAIAQVSCGG